MLCSEIPLLLFGGTLKRVPSGWSGMEVVCRPLCTEGTFSWWQPVGWSRTYPFHCYHKDGSPDGSRVDTIAPSVMVNPYCYGEHSKHHKGRSFGFIKLGQSCRPKTKGRVRTSNPPSLSFIPWHIANKQPRITLFGTEKNWLLPFSYLSTTA